MEGNKSALTNESSWDPLACNSQDESVELSVDELADEANLEKFGRGSRSSSKISGRKKSIGRIEEMSVESRDGAEPIKNKRTSISEARLENRMDEESLMFHERDLDAALHEGEDRPNRKSNPDEYIYQIGDSNCLWAPNKPRSFRDFFSRCKIWSILNLKQILAGLTGE